MTNKQTLENKLICVGKVVSAHGIKGAVNILSYTDPLSNIFKYTLYTENQKLMEIINHSHKNKGIYICTVKGINNREDAQLLSNHKLYISRENLEGIESNDQYYIEDIIGMSVENKQGDIIGTVFHIANFGAGDILEIKLENGVKKMFSFSTNNILKIDVNNKLIQIDDQAIV